VRDTIGYGIFFASYESLKQLLSVSRGNDAIPVAGAIAGGLCGVLSFACVSSRIFKLDETHLTFPSLGIPYRLEKG
jgi:hypothetical protein